MTPRRLSCTYEPGNPDANASGFVAYPAINPVKEMADLMDQFARTS